MVTLPAPDDDVEKILTGIMAKQSPLMKQARYQGQASAQAVGLGQSTMGIKASQAAAYQAALPIASQQAQAGLQKGMQQSQFGHETGMQQAGFQHAASQADLDRQQQIAALREQGYLERLAQVNAGEVERGRMAFQQQFEAQQSAQQRAMQERLAAMEMTGADRERAMAALTQGNNAWSAAYAQIASNENLPADARNNMLASVDLMREHNQNLTTSLFRNVIPW